MGERTSKRRWAVHPPFFALHPPLTLYAANVSLIPAQDVLLPCLGSLLLALVLWVLLGTLLSDLVRGAIAASVVTYSFFSYDVLSGVWVQTTNGSAAAAFQTPMPITAWLAFSGLLAAGFAWKARWSSAVNTLLNIMGPAMCGLALYSVAASHWAIRSELARAAREAVGIQGNQSDSKEKGPDIFYVVLDGFGSDETFRRLYGFSSELFLKELEKRGFYVAREARANYCQTELSLASSLNMAPLQDFDRSLGSADDDRGVLAKHIDDSRAARFLKERGYRLFAITTGFPALKFEKADVRIERDSGLSIYLDALLKKTPFRLTEGMVTSMFDERRKEVLGGFRSLKGIAAPGASPKFAIVHILAPHPPFVFGPNGEPRRPTKGGYGLWDGNAFVDRVGSKEEYIRGYREQCQYLMKLVLEAADSLIKANPNAVVLLQGDHGPKAHLDLNSAAKTDMEEVFGILSAIRAPDSVKARLHPSISPWNSFRAVLGGLFSPPPTPSSSFHSSGPLRSDEEGAFALLPDHSYYSEWDHPLRFVEVLRSKSSSKQP